MLVLRLKKRKLVRKNKFIISGGGTGGHIYPAISIANMIMKSIPNSEVRFVGAIGKMEMKIIPKHGFKIKGLWISGLQRSLSIKNILVPFKLIVSLIQSLIELLIFKPKFVIGTGGYASFPMLFISSLFKVPTLIQEQNSLPGISNKLLSRHADYISVAYEKMDKYFPGNKIYLTGNPIRESITKNINISHYKKTNNITDDILVLTVLGGSLGAERINRVIEDNIEFIKSKNVFLIWQCGSLYFENYKHFNSDFIKIIDFIDDIDSVYQISDIIIARSGALTLSELAVVGKPSILIPSPNVAENHQFLNAKTIEEKDACICIEEKDLELIFKNKLDLLINDENLRKELSRNISRMGLPNASSDIVEIIKKHFNDEP